MFLLKISGEHVGMLFSFLPKQKFGQVENVIFEICLHRYVHWPEDADVITKFSGIDRFSISIVIGLRRAREAPLL